jgi:hypothetical protein
LQNYPSVRLLVGYGQTLSLAGGLGVFLFLLLGVMVADWHWIWIPGGFFLGVITYFLVRTLSELSKIIVDMLMPE